MKMSNHWIRIGLLLGLLIITQTYVRADSTTPAASTPAPAPAANAAAAEEKKGTDAEKVNVDTIKEKYWARGDESELGVVQNRLYSKASKIELGIYGGIISSDPFLNVQSLGFSAGYHFNEYISVHALYWKEFNQASSAETSLESTTNGVHSDSNPAQYFYGAEARASLIYGKLSIVGKAIIYYDLHVLGGLGNTHTESKGSAPITGETPFDKADNHVTGLAGIGQQIYLSKFASLTLDYRAMVYSENQYEQNAAASYGNALGTRTNWSHSITLGVSFLIGIFK